MSVDKIALTQDSVMRALKTLGVTRRLRITLEFRGGRPRTALLSAGPCWWGWRYAGEGGWAHGVLVDVEGDASGRWYAVRLMLVSGHVSAFTGLAPPAELFAERLHGVPFRDLGEATGMREEWVTVG